MNNGSALPSLDSLTTSVSQLGSAAIGYLGMDVIQILLGIGLIFLAIKLAKRAVNKLVYLIVIAAIYLFSRGILSMGTLLEWWDKLPGFINQIFVLGRSIM